MDAAATHKTLPGQRIARSTRGETCSCSQVAHRSSTPPFSSPSCCQAPPARRHAVELPGRQKPAGSELPTRVLLRCDALDSGLSVMQPAVKLLPLCCKCVSCFANHRCYNPLPTMRRRSSCHFCRCTDACYLRLHDAPLICVPSQASTHNAVNRPSHREQPGRPLSEPRHRECRATRCSMLHTLTRMPHTGGCQLPPKYCCSLPSQRSPLRLVFESSRPRALQLLLRLCQLLRSTLRQPSLLRALSPAVVVARDVAPAVAPAVTVACSVTPATQLPLPHHQPVAIGPRRLMSRRLTPTAPASLCRCQHHHCAFAIERKREQAASRPDAAVEPCRTSCRTALPATAMRRRCSRRRCCTRSYGSRCHSCICHFPSCSPAMQS